MTRILYRKGDLFAHDCDALLHGVNTLGVMGAGVAKTFRSLYPEAYEDYRAACKAAVSPEKILGGVRYFQNDRYGEAFLLSACIQSTIGPPRAINYEAMFRCLEKVNKLAKKGVVRRLDRRPNAQPYVAMPKIGCGLAGGDWGVVSAMIDATATHYQPVVYEL